MRRFKNDEGCDECTEYERYKTTANKDVSCCECGASIKESEEYFFSRGWDEEWSEPCISETCLSCAEIQDYVREHMYQHVAFYREYPFFHQGLNEDITAYMEIGKHESYPSGVYFGFLRLVYKREKRMEK